MIRLFIGILLEFCYQCCVIQETNDMCEQMTRNILFNTKTTDIKKFRCD